MKKLVANICAIALGVLASIMAFVPMFQYFSVTGDNKVVSTDYAFGLFGKPDDGIVALFEGINETYSNIFKVVAAVLAGIMIACVVVYIVVALIGLFNKKSDFAAVERIVGIILIACAILFVIATIIFFCANNVSGEVAKVAYTRGFEVSNWFAYLAVILGFGGAGAFALCGSEQPKKKKKRK